MQEFNMICSKCKEIFSEKIEPEKNLKNSLSGPNEPIFQEEKIFKVQCPHCGIYGSYTESRLKSENEKASLILNPPQNRKEMKEAIISVLKRLYPRRTGYNGSHLEPLDTHNREMFFAALRELEEDGLIEYNDTDIFMRLTDKYFELEKQTVIASD